MYIRIFIAERLRVTEISPISFFFFLFLFHFIIFFTCNDLYFCCLLCISSRWSVSVFGLITSIDLLVEMFRIITHSCLEMLGMYGVTWFPQKSHIRTKSKWVKNKTVRTDTNQTKRIKNKQKRKCLCASWYWTGKNSSRRLILGYKACLHPPVFHVWLLSMLFVLIFISSLIIEKQHLASSPLYETRGEILMCVLSVDAPGITWLLTGLLLPMRVFST